MKKRIYQYALVIMLSLTAIASQAAIIGNSSDKEKIAMMSKEQKEAKINAIKIRVNEIRAMDKSTLTRVEKKALRHELRDMKKEANAAGNGGVYLSVGAIIIIILLLILIL